MEIGFKNEPIIVDDIELIKQFIHRKKQILSKDLTQYSISDLVVMLFLLAGQQRSHKLEDWFAQNVYSGKVDKNIDCGDLTNFKVYDELKSRFLSQNEINKGIIHQCGQVRLWQKVDNYLFFTVNTDTFETFIYYIPKTDLINLIKNGKVQYSSSHVKGNSSIKKEFIYSDFSSKIELHLTFNNKVFNFDKYLLSIDQLINKLK